MPVSDLADLPPETLILTPNERLARHLRARDDASLHEASAWEPRPIMSWRSWLQRLWDETLSWEGRHPILLRPAQEAALWQQVLEESPEGGRLLNPRAAARTATEAWHLLREHRGDLDPTDPTLDGDARAFAGWVERVQQRCQASGWLDPARLAETLEGLLPEAGPALPPGVALVGFDRVPPGHRRFLEVLEETGCRVEIREAQGQPGDFVTTHFADPESEACAAVLWARGLVVRDPRVRVALVVPDLGAARSLLERVLEDLLCPEAVLPARSRRLRPYDFSLGRALADRGLVGDALQILHLAHGPRPLEQVGALLRSPHLGGAETEQGQRGLLEAALRRRLLPEVSLSTILGEARASDPAGQPRPHACPLLCRFLEALTQAVRDLPGGQSPARWSEAFDALLQAAGWPGERPPDSEDSQVRLRFGEVLAELRGLDLVRPSMTFMQALGALTSLCREAIFQPRTPEAPVQVLGFLEAAGLEFDATWLVGVHDEAWPPAAHPNPYLPLDLQRRLEMPHSSATRELEFARRVTRRILQGAPLGVASHARAEADREMRPSALLKHLPEGQPGIPPTQAPQTQVLPARLWRDLLHEAGRLEPASDRPPPPLPAGTLARGGTGLFKLQAACPFRAFAEIRLKARPLEKVQPGLDARQRGTLVHQALEATWKALRSQRTLLERSPEELQDLVREAADQALDRLARRRPDLVHGRFRDLERERLTRLVLEWLEVDKERSPFQVVGFEASMRMELAGLVFDAQLDRLDRLQDGSLAVLDYKTGRPSPKNWLGDRPEEPQLPLYCTGAGERTGAVLFAQVRPGDMKLKGVSAAPGLHPQVPCLDQSDFAVCAGSWQELLNHWRAVLTSLGAQFRQGLATVTPLKRETCRFCTLHPLCRVHDLRPWDDQRED